MEAAAPVASKDERATRTEQIAGSEQGDDEQATIVNPGENGGEVAGGNVGTDETVENHDRGGDEQDELNGGAGMTPPQRRPDDRPAEDVDGWN